jgi:hypothetical protein
MVPIGTRVTMLYPNPAIPRIGVIYDYIPYKIWPYHVRPGGWPEDRLGIACTETALVPFDTLPQTNKRLSKPIDDATEVG